MMQQPTDVARIAEGMIRRWAEVLLAAARQDPDGVARVVRDETCAGAAVVLQRADIASTERAA